MLYQWIKNSLFMVNLKHFKLVECLKSGDNEFQSECLYNGCTVPCVFAVCL